LFLRRSTRALEIDVKRGVVLAGYGELYVVAVLRRNSSSAEIRSWSRGFLTIICRTATSGVS
jgi:hypothetical protein